MIHELKCRTPYFSMVRLGTKTFEVRKNDRNFIASDYLRLREWTDDAGYTGEECTVFVTFVLRGGEFGIDPDYCVMSFKLANDQPAGEEPAQRQEDRG